MTDPIGKRIDALQGRIAGIQSRLETVQRELKEVALEYVRNDEIQRRETARANADDLVVDAVVDPDCRDGKHSSCVGGPCQCPCHELAAS